MIINPSALMKRNKRQQRKQRFSSNDTALQLMILDILRRRKRGGTDAFSGVLGEGDDPGPGGGGGGGIGTWGTNFDPGPQPGPPRPGFPNPVGIGPGTGPPGDSFDNPDFFGIDMMGF